MNSMYLDFSSNYSNNNTRCQLEHGRDDEINKGFGNPNGRIKRNQGKTGQD